MTARLFRISALLVVVIALGACAGMRGGGTHFSVQVTKKPAKWDRFSKADYAEIVTRNCKVEIVGTASKQVAASFDNAVSIRTPGKGTLKVWLMDVHKERDEKSGKLVLLHVYTKDSINRPGFVVDAGATYDIDCVNHYTVKDPLSQLMGWHVTVTKRTAASPPAVVFDSRKQPYHPPASASPKGH